MLPLKRLGQIEFVALAASLMAATAFSIDAMLPALPEIGAELSPEDLNKSSLIVQAFIFGMGLGTFVVGPISDAYGRRPIIFFGAAVFLVGSWMCWSAEDLNILLFGRFLQGVGAAAQRVVTVAIVRDMYAGRGMAQIMSFIMSVFTLAPAAAPAIGALIIAGFDWRAIFIALALFVVIGVCWLGVRQPETLTEDARRPLKLKLLWDGTKTILSMRVVLVSTLVQSFVLATLFMLISSIQQVVDLYFGRGDQFPIWFATIALTVGLFSLLNAKLVMRLGMRKIVGVAMILQLGISLVVLAVFWFEMLPVGPGFFVFLVWSMTIFGMIGLAIGNLNAIALEPLGHMAGLGTSVTASVSTVLSVLLSVPVSQAFDGTPVPLAVGITLSVLAANLFFRFTPES